jgi:steroid 5-alpha reductase family enzyme
MDTSLVANPSVSNLLAGHVVLTNLVLVTIIMLFSWFFYLFQRNPSFLDVAWSLGFIVTIVTAFSGCHGYFLRKLIFFIIAFAWAVRLGGYFFIRYMKQAREGRFQAFREAFGAISELKFGLIFILQGFLVVVLSWPFVLICSNATPHISALEWTGIVITLVAFMGESFADKQLWHFKQQEGNQGKVCQEGLWKYSRHPNYFFEWLIWVGFFIFALAAPLGITAIISPILMWYLLTQISGIQMAELQTLKTKGDSYKEYQEKTNAFFPWFPKK